jgi:preprotein translocase subunit SecE
MLEKWRNGLQLTTDELTQKTTWPTWEELQSSAIVVLVASLIIALMIFVVDSAFNKLFDLFYTVTR